MYGGGWADVGWEVRCAPWQGHGEKQGAGEGGKASPLAVVTKLGASGQLISV